MFTFLKQMFVRGYYTMRKGSTVCSFQEITFSKTEIQLFKLLLNNNMLTQTFQTSDNAFSIDHHMHVLKR